MMNLVGLAQKSVVSHTHRQPGCEGGSVSLIYWQVVHYVVQHCDSIRPPHPVDLGSSPGQCVAAVERMTFIPWRCKQ
jgi:hypothetical protein